MNARFAAPAVKLGVLNAHVARRRDAMLDLAVVHEEVIPLYAAKGQPFINLNFALHMRVIGNVMMNPSERPIRFKIQASLPGRWFYRLA